MNSKDGGWDLSDLEKEIDLAVDKLFVQQDGDSEHLVQHKKGSSPITKEAKEPDRDHPSLVIPPTREKKMLPRELREKLEEVEAQLLTLEWDINSKHINRAINLLQDLREFPDGKDEIKEVVILIQKVLYQLLLDENKLTPIALKFLQRSWKAVKGMNDERFSFEIDKKTLVGDLKEEFRRLKLDEEMPKERKEEIRERKEEAIAKKPPEEIIAPKPPEEIIAKRPPKEIISRKYLEETGIPSEQMMKVMNKIQELEDMVNEEKNRLENIYQEIISFKTKLRKGPSVEKEVVKEPEEEEIVDLDERLGEETHISSDLIAEQPTKASFLIVSLFEASGVVFGIPQDHILRSFPVKKWVADFFIKSGRVKLKDKDIPLLDLFQVFRLRESTEENPLIILVKRSKDSMAAVIVDQALSREEIEYHPVERKPYILGKGVSGKEEVWIIDVEQILQ